MIWSHAGLVGLIDHIGVIVYIVNYLITSGLYPALLGTLRCLSQGLKSCLVAQLSHLVAVIFVSVFLVALGRLLFSCVYAFFVFVLCYIR